MCKGLKELEKLEQYWGNQKPLSISQGLKIVSVIGKELKALDIIKVIFDIRIEKNKFGQCFVSSRNNIFAISNETYDLLNEVLNGKIY